MRGGSTEIKRSVCCAFSVFVPALLNVRIKLFIQTELFRASTKDKSANLIDQFFWDAASHLVFPAIRSNPFRPLRGYWHNRNAKLIEPLPNPATTGRSSFRRLCQVCQRLTQPGISPEPAKMGRQEITCFIRNFYMVALGYFLREPYENFEPVILLRESRRLVSKGSWPRAEFEGLDRSPVISPKRCFQHFHANLLLGVTFAQQKSAYFPLALVRTGQVPEKYRENKLNRRSRMPLSPSLSVSAGICEAVAAAATRLPAGDERGARRLQCTHTLFEPALDPTVE